MILDFIPFFIFSKRYMSSTIYSPRFSTPFYGIPFYFVPILIWACSRLFFKLEPIFWADKARWGHYYKGIISEALKKIMRWASRDTQISVTWQFPRDMHKTSSWFVRLFRRKTAEDEDPDLDNTMKNLRYTRGMKAGKLIWFTITEKLFKLWKFSWSASGDELSTGSTKWSSDNWQKYI